MSIQDKCIWVSVVYLIVELYWTVKMDCSEKITDRNFVGWDPAQIPEALLETRTALCLLCARDCYRKDWLCVFLGWWCACSREGNERGDREGLSWAEWSRVRWNALLKDIIASKDDCWNYSVFLNEEMVVETIYLIIYQIKSSLVVWVLVLSYLI